MTQLSFPCSKGGVPIQISSLVRRGVCTTQIATIWRGWQLIRLQPISLILRSLWLRNRQATTLSEMFCYSKTSRIRKLLPSVWVKFKLAQFSKELPKRMMSGTLLTSTRRLLKTFPSTDPQKLRFVRTWKPMNIWISILLTFSSTNTMSL